MDLITMVYIQYTTLGSRPLGLPSLFLCSRNPCRSFYHKQYLLFQSLMQIKSKVFDIGSQ